MLLPQSHKPSIELGRSVVAMLEENIFLKYLNLYIPALKDEAFISCKNYLNGCEN